MDRIFSGALGLVFCLALAGCGGGGGGAPQPTPTPRPTPGPAEAVEAAAGVVRSTLIGVATFIAQGTDTRSNGGSAGQARRRAVSLWHSLHAQVTGLVSRSALGSGQYAVRGECPRGGSVDVSCSEHGASTTVSSSYSSCGLVDATTGDVEVASGGLVITLAATGVCSSGVLPQDVRYALQAKNLVGTVADANGTIIERFAANFSEEFEPAGQGCAGANGSETFDGSLSDQRTGGAADLSLNAHGLSLVLTSSGTPCVQHIAAHGSLDVQDHVSQARFSESLDGVAVTLIDQGNDNTAATLDGRLTNDCLGEVQVRTSTALQFVRGEACPVGGLVVVSRGDDTDGRVAFNASGGAAFDFDADGTTDKEISRCNEAAQCPE